MFRIKLKFNARIRVILILKIKWHYTWKTNHNQNGKLIKNYHIFAVGCLPLKTQCLTLNTAFVMTFEHFVKCGK
jgi:hypothetical protein